MSQFNPPYPAKQIGLQQLLTASRSTVLRQAVADALAISDPADVARDLDACASAESRQVLAAAGIRDEFVFATPTVLRAKPTTLGYYRLLLGVSQKAFYTSETGFGRLKAMELNGRIPNAAGDLTDACAAINAQVAELISQISPSVSPLDVDQLPLLTLGSQFDGSWRNGIGKAAAADVFLAVHELVAHLLTDETSTTLTLVNSSGRTVTIRLASDPDLAISEVFPGGTEELQAAIEIKGGTDRSNAHNRAGEAEKSHRKVSGSARDFWTLIAMKGVDKAQLALESPTTRRWYDIASVLARAGNDWERFRNDLRGAVGI